MAYLVIPEITDNEDLISYSVESDGKNFTVVIAAAETATRLMSAVAKGELLTLVVIMSDSTQAFALDNVYVTSASVSSGGGPDAAQAVFGLQAEEVRVL